MGIKNEAGCHESQSVWLNEVYLRHLRKFCTRFHGRKGRVIIKTKAFGTQMATSSKATPNRDFGRGPVRFEGHSEEGSWGVIIMPILAPFTLKDGTVVSDE